MGNEKELEGHEYPIFTRLIKARFPLGDLFRAKRLLIVKIEQISDLLQSTAHKTKEIVASREKSRLVENGLKRVFFYARANF